MENPNKQLKEYLKTLTTEFIILNTILIEVNKLLKWNSEKGPDAVDTGLLFYKFSLECFRRILTIETYKLLSKGEQKSLVDWLDKARIHANKLEPGRIVVSEERNLNLRKMPPSEYIDIINSHFDSISDHHVIIENLKGLRNKGFAHSDAKYFNDKAKLEIDYPVTWYDFNILFNTISEILKEQYGLLFNSDMDMELYGCGNIDNILTQCRAFSRVWNNEKLLKMNMNFDAFKQDNYDPDDIFLKNRE